MNQLDTMTSLPTIQSFQLNNLLTSLQDDSIDQLLLSISSLNTSLANDLNTELRDSVRFQNDNINSLLVKNVKLLKNFKNVRNLSKLNLDDELLSSIRGNSENAKDLVQKLYKLDKFLPVRERLFEDSTSHKLHYPVLYQVGSKLLDLTDDVVSLASSPDHDLSQNHDLESQNAETADLNNTLPGRVASESESHDLESYKGEEQREEQSELETNRQAADSEPSPQDIPSPDKSRDEDSIRSQSFGSSHDPLDKDMRELQEIYKLNTKESKTSIRDHRISLLSQNIDDIISERVQQQQLRKISTTPTSFIFPSQLTKKTSSQFNEDVRLIIVKDPNDKQVLFGLKKFL